jgi:hypothetical protein
MQRASFQASLIWTSPELGRAAERVGATSLRRKMELGERGEGFGLIERVAGGWALCIPHGAEAKASVAGAPVDLDRLDVEPSGERRLPLCAGLRAEVRMGEYSFEVEPAAA